MSRAGAIAAESSIEEAKKKIPPIHINIGEVGTMAKVGHLSPRYAFDLDIATRRSASDIAIDRLYKTGFPRVITQSPVDPNLVESARRSVSPRRGSAASAAGLHGEILTKNSAALAHELECHSGGGSLNLSLLSSSRYFHSPQSTISGVHKSKTSTPRNVARSKIQQVSQLPYGREAFDGISDTGDSLYRADFCRRYKINAPSERYQSSIEVMKNQDRVVHKEEAPPKFLTQTPRGIKL